MRLVRCGRRVGSAGTAPASSIDGRNRVQSQWRRCYGWKRLETAVRLSPERAINLNLESAKHHSDIARVPAYFPQVKRFSRFTCSHAPPRLMSISSIGADSVLPTTPDEVRPLESLTEIAGDALISPVLEQELHGIRGYALEKDAMEPLQPAFAQVTVFRSSSQKCAPSNSMHEIRKNRRNQCVPLNS